MRSPRSRLASASSLGPSTAKPPEAGCRPDPERSSSKPDDSGVLSSFRQVIHTPGHSPDGIALYERTTGILLPGDVIYDDPLINEVS